MRLRKPATECPVCGGAAPWDESAGFHVCERCRELLHPDELVPRATWRTRAKYVRRNHPNESRAWLRENGYA